MWFALNAIGIYKDWEACTEALDIILVAEVLYDSKNLPLLDQFIARAPEVLVADSRVKHFNVPPYRKIAAFDSFTIPALAEPDEFDHVSIYYANCS